MLFEISFILTILFTSGFIMNAYAIEISTIGVGEGDVGSKKIPMKQGQTIDGIFFISGSYDDPILFWVTDPDNEKIFDEDREIKLGTEFSFTAEKDGNYIFNFRNVPGENIFGFRSIHFAHDIKDPPEPEDENGGCLIATATYGSEMSSQVQQLRELRDNSLLTTESGTSFMESFNDVYYSFSPIIADYERENPVFKEMVRIVITPMISSLSILNHVDMDSEESVLGYGISLIIVNIGMYVGIPTIVIIGIRKRF